MRPLMLEIGVSGAFLGLKIVLSFCFGIWVLLYRYIQVFLFVFLRVIEQYAHGHIQFMLDFYKDFL